MKRKLLLTFLFYFTITRLSAQVPFNTIDSIDINSVSAPILVHGDMWWQPDSSEFTCHFPAGSAKIINGPGSLWMSGYDATGQLHIAAQTYRQTGNDYWPGPLNTSDTLTYATSQAWAKIWKVNNSDIQTFLALTTHTTANTPQSILTWPGKGNTNAQGNGGVSLSITTDMAPFVDLNGNGIYEPLQGEYPDIKGDQAAWWVFSDNGPAHSQTNGVPLDVEIHAMTYAYSRGTLIDDVVYYEYSIVNKSANNYNNFRVAQWDRLGLGAYQMLPNPAYTTLNNYIGFDSLWRMGITYHGNNDDEAFGGYPVPNVYGLNPPMTAVTMIVLPGDTGADYISLGCFVYYNNDNSVIGNPTVDTQYNNYMRAKILNGEHFSDDFTGAGMASKGYGSGPDCNYVFPGDPSDHTQWSECACNNNPGEISFVLSSNDFTFTAGSTQKVVFALLVADTARGCPVTSFNDISIVADTAWADYYNPPAQTAVKNIVPANSVSIYPNPANNVLYIQTSGSMAGNESITIYNTLGQKINLPVMSTGTKDIIDVSSLPPAMYYIVYGDGNLQKTAKFLKE